MSNEMKLLTALCEALGFEVEIKLDRKERKETPESAMQYNGMFGGFERELLAINGKLDIDSDGMYTSYLRKPETSYNLKKIEQYKEIDHG